MEGGVCVLPAAAVPSLASPLLEVFSVVSVERARCSAHQGRAVADALCLDFRALTLAHLYLVFSDDDPAGTSQLPWGSHSHPVRKGLGQVALSLSFPVHSAVVPFQFSAS